MSVKDYYLAHFDEMSIEKRKHFATRLKYWLGDESFDEFLAQNEPSHDIAEVLANNNYSNVNNLDEREKFFKKYPQLYGLEAALSRLNRLLIEYGVDLRDEFLKHFSRDKLYWFCDTLLDDTEAIVKLSTYAVNVLCLTEILFPRRRNICRELAEKMLAQPEQTIDYVYLYTHIILCDSDYYTRRLPLEDADFSRKMLEQCTKIICDNYEKVTLDMKLEFLVCGKIANFNADELEQKIAAECKEILNEQPYLVDSKKEERFNTLDGAEHRNVLLIMAGLDY